MARVINHPYIPCNSDNSFKNINISYSLINWSGSDLSCTDIFFLGQRCTDINLSTDTYNHTYEHKCSACLAYIKGVWALANSSINQRETMASNVNIRRSANYKPNIWKQDFLQSLSSLYDVSVCTCDHIFALFFIYFILFEIIYNILII